MGAPMAARLAAAGHELHAWNRTGARVEPLQALGATVSPSAQAAIGAAGIVFTMLSDAAAIRATVLDPPAVALAGRTLVQMGTIGPQDSRDLAAAVEQSGGRYLEAPVLGSTPQAAAGELIVMAAGAQRVFDDVRPLLEVLGPEPRWLGAVGSASAMKLALNQLIAGLTASFALSLGLVRGLDVSVDEFMAILRRSALYAPTFDKKLARMLAADYARPNFSAAHLTKDVRLFLDAARPLGLQVQALEALTGLLDGAASRPQPEDYAALYAVIDPRHAGRGPGPQAAAVPAPRLEESGP